MGYESKVYIVNVFSHNDVLLDGTIRKGYGEIVAMVDMCKMGYNNGWKELFTKPIDYEIYAENGDESTGEDKYGDSIKSGDLTKIIAWLEYQIKIDDYRRLKPLLAILKAFDPDEWKDLQILHYGY